MSIFKNKNSLRAIVAQIVQKLKNNEARSKFIEIGVRDSLYNLKKMYFRNCFTF